ncbi:MAG TPA: molybdate ABC transporter substrate-binding protein [Bryobacteraceae bacterium]|nr:molybdate ABC transporter substrate-binding protein [Bryobacteraceae bacterium]
MYRRRFMLSLASAAAGCGEGARDERLTVAAAANLIGVFDEIGSAFTRGTQVPVTFSYGATALLAHQIANGAPFDVFAAADTEHPAELFAAGRVERPVNYARGRLALWAPRKPQVKTLADLASPEVRFIAVARAAAAPYGAAAVEALRRAGLWEQVESKIVYAGNINMAREYANSGSADAALTAWSLVMRERGAVLVDAGLHAAIVQAVAVVTRSPRAEQARRFVSFLLDDTAQRILGARGYERPRP